MIQMFNENIENKSNISILIEYLKKAINNRENLYITIENDLFIDDILSYLKNNNYKINILNVNNKSSSDLYNPLLATYLIYEYDDKELAVNLINSLGLLIFKNNDEITDHFWNDSAQKLYTNIILYLFENENIGNINLQTVVDFLKQPIDDLYTVLSNHLDKIDEEDKDYYNYYLFNHGINKTFESVLEQCQIQLNNFINNYPIFLGTNDQQIDFFNINSKTVYLFIENNYELSNYFLLQFLCVNEIPFTFIFNNFNIKNNNCDLNKFFDYLYDNDGKLFMLVDKQVNKKLEEEKKYIQKEDSDLDLIQTMNSKKIQDAIPKEFYIDDEVESKTLGKVYFTTKFEIYGDKVFIEEYHTTIFNNIPLVIKKMCDFSYSVCYEELDDNEEFDPNKCVMALENFISSKDYILDEIVKTAEKEYKEYHYINNLNILEIIVSGEIEVFYDKISFHGTLVYDDGSYSVDDDFYYIDFNFDTKTRKIINKIHLDQ